MGGSPGELNEDKFIRRIVACDEKWFYYYNPAASKQSLGLRQPAKYFVKKSVRPQCNVRLVEF